METISERRAREAAIQARLDAEAKETSRETAARQRVEQAANALGGMSGNAANALRSRKSRLDAAIEEAEGN